MLRSIKFFITLFLSVFLFVFAFQSSSNLRCFKNEFLSNSSLTLNIKTLNPLIHSIACDPSNNLILRIKVLNSSGIPVPITLSVSDNKGRISPSDIKTDKCGESLVTYYPPEYDSKLLMKENDFVTITSKIKGTTVKSSIKVELKRTPIIFIHGYQATSGAFANMSDFYNSKGYETSAMDYKSENGVEAASKILCKTLYDKKMYYMSMGFQVQKFDLVAHSMGGLVARFYSCGKEYFKYCNIRKVIFVSVPQNGSPLASLGEAYFEDQGIKDLVPDNKLYTSLFPKMINKGLNNNIQVGSICDQFDEVVNKESSTLEEWNICTEMYVVHSNNTQNNNLFNGDIIQAINHNNILNNKNVIERIYGMLTSQLPYPALLR